MIYLHGSHYSWHSWKTPGFCNSWKNSYFPCIPGILQIAKASDIFFNVGSSRDLLRIFLDSYPVSFEKVEEPDNFHSDMQEVLGSRME